MKIVIWIIIASDVLYLYVIDTVVIYVFLCCSTWLCWNISLYICFWSVSSCDPGCHCVSHRSVKVWVVVVILCVIFSVVHRRCRLTCDICCRLTCDLYFIFVVGSFMCLLVTSVVGISIVVVLWMSTYLWLPMWLSASLWPLLSKFQLLLIRLHVT